MAPRGKKSYSKDRYFQSDVTSTDKIVPEGVEGEVPYRGPLNAVLYQMIGGLHQSMFYIGAHNIPEMSEKGRFIRITDAGLNQWIGAARRLPCMCAALAIGRYRHAQTK